MMINIKDKEIKEAQEKIESLQKKIEKNKKKLENNKKTFEKVQRINMQLKKLICTGVTYKEKALI